MKYKKGFCFFMVIGLIFSSSAFALGHSTSYTESTKIIIQSVPVPERSRDEGVKVGNLSESRAIELAKEYIKDFYGEVIVDGDGFQINSNFTEDWQNRDQRIWRIDLNKSSSQGYVYYSVSMLDKDSSLLEIRRHREPQEGEPKAAQFTQEEAEDIALKFLRKYNPNILKELILDQNYNSHQYYYNQMAQGLHPREYSVFYTRKYKDIPVINQGVQVGVNNATGEVTSYRISWSSEAIPEYKIGVTAEEAMNIFKDNFKSNLVYISVRDRSKGYSDDVEEVRLVYIPSFQSGFWVDAETGEMISPALHIQAEAVKKIDLSLSEREALKGLSSSRLRSDSKEMTREEATKYVEVLLKSIYPDNEVSIQRSSYNSASHFGTRRNMKVWEVQYSIENDYVIDGSATIDAITGEVIWLSLHNWMHRDIRMSGSKEFTPQIEWEEAYYKAIEYLKTLYPHKLKYLQFEQSFHENIHHYNGRRIVNPEYNFTFTHIENNIPYRDNHINLSIDSSNGLLQRVHYSWNNVSLPKPRNLITEERAMDLFMSQIKIELGYITRQNRETNINEIKLAYVTRPNNAIIHQYIDAKSGEIVDFLGQLVEENDRKVNVNGRLDGHYAERILRIMAANGIIDFQKVNIGNKMTKNEIVKMIVNSFGNIHYGERNEQLKFTDIDVNNEYYKYIEQAVMYNLIENEEKQFEGYKNMTREELAGLLIKMTPFRQAAKLTEIYTLPVEDLDEINSDKLGSVAILYGFDVMKGYGNSFRPTEEVTLEQAAVAVYRVFNLFGRMRYFH